MSNQLRSGLPNPRELARQTAAQALPPGFTIGGRDPFRPPGLQAGFDPQALGALPGRATAENIAGGGAPEQLPPNPNKIPPRDLQPKLTKHERQLRLYAQLLEQASQAGIKTTKEVKEQLVRDALQSERGGASVEGIPKRRFTDQTTQRGGVPTASILESDIFRPQRETIEQSFVRAGGPAGPPDPAAGPQPVPFADVRAELEARGQLSPGQPINPGSEEAKRQQFTSDLLGLPSPRDLETPFISPEEQAQVTAENQGEEERKKKAEADEAALAELNALAAKGTDRDRLREVNKKINFQRSMAGIAEGLGQIATSQRKAGEIRLRGFGVGGGQAIEDFSADNINQDIGALLEQRAVEEGKKADPRFNPASPTSKFMRQWAKEVLGKDLPEQMSAFELEASPLLNSAFQAAFQRETRLSGMKPFKRSADEQKELVALENTITQLADLGLVKNRENFNTGPLVELMSNMAFFIGVDGVLGISERAGFKSRIRNVVQEYMKSLQGSRASDIDLQEFRKLMPAASDSDTAFMSKANNVMGLLVNKLHANRERFKRAGGIEPEGSEPRIVPITNLKTGEVLKGTATEALEMSKAGKRRFLTGLK